MVHKTINPFDKQVELDNCNFVKATLMLLVVLYHSIIFWTGSWFDDVPVYQSEILAMMARWMNTFHIYGFTLVSGYLFYYLKYEQGKYTYFRPFIVQKAKRLLVPYVFVAVVWVIPISCLFFSFGLKEFITKFVLARAPGQLWFLLMLFGVFLIFYPLSDFLKEQHVLGAVTVIGVYGAGIMGQIILDNTFQLSRACLYIPVFWGGFKLRQWGTDWLYRVPAWLWLFVHASLFVLTQYLYQFDGAIFTLLRMGVQFVLHIVGALMAFTWLQKIADKVSWKNSRAFTFVSKLSMPIYLLHQQVIYVFIYCFNGLLNPYIHAVVNFAGAMVVSLVLSSFLMRFRITRFLIGEK